MPELKCPGRIAAPSGGHQLQGLPIQMVSQVKPCDAHVLHNDTCLLFSRANPSQNVQVYTYIHVYTHVFEYVYVVPAPSGGRQLQGLPVQRFPQAESHNPHVLG